MNRKTNKSCLIKNSDNNNDNVNFIGEELAVMSFNLKIQTKGLFITLVDVDMHGWSGIPRLQEERRHVPLRF